MEGKTLTELVRKVEAVIDEIETDKAREKRLKFWLSQIISHIYYYRHLIDKKEIMSIIEELEGYGSDEK